MPKARQGERNRSKLLHTTRRMTGSRLTVLQVWSRGAYAGSLTVKTEDAGRIQAAMSIKAEDPALSHDDNPEAGF